MKQNQVFLFYIALIVLSGAIGYKIPESSLSGNRIQNGLVFAAVGLLASQLLFIKYRDQIYE